MSAGEGGVSGGANADGKPAVEVDEDLYSRVQYVLGADAMKKMAGSSVLVCGAGGLGAEVAKNLVLTGIGSVTLHDPAPVSWWDLGSLFWAGDADVGRRRVDVLAPRLSELNHSCPVRVADTLTAAELARHVAVVWCDWADPLALDDAQRALRGRGTKMVWAEARGVMGMLFADVGDEHVVTDDTGIEPVRAVVVGVEGATVTVDDDEPLGVSRGDFVVLSGVETRSGSGASLDGRYRVADVASMYSYVLEGLVCPAGEYLRGGYVTGVKEPRTMSSLCFRDALAQPQVGGDLMSDSGALHAAFCALHRWSHTRGGALPAVHDAAQAAEVAAESGGGDSAEGEAARVLSLLCGVSFNPLVCFVGGVAAQEVLKGCTSKYCPIDQFYYIDCRHMFPGGAAASPPPPSSNQATRYASTEAVVGVENARRVRDLKYFVVGCGALGCELLKNLAMVGVGAGKKGFVTVTDPDRIERSNLSRQFLFRSSHVGDFKSKVAKDAAKAINPAVKVMAKTTKVCRETEDVLDDRFWDKQDGVITALDNVAARLYCDQKCVRHMRRMFDSGTLGPQAHSQVIIPRLSENYGAQRDPVEKNIPQCTLHFFPNSVEHTIAFGRDWFGGAFESPCASVEAYNDSPEEYGAKLAAMPTAARKVEVCALHETLTVRCVEDCVRWAREQFQKLFVHFVADVLRQHPLDKTDENGKLFWVGKYKPPTALVFDPDSRAHLDFVIAVARMKAHLHCIEWVPCDVRGAVGSFCAAPYDGSMAEDERQVVEETACEAMMETVAAAGKLPRVQAIAFDKDCSTNGHLECIAAVANLRSISYGIPTTTVAEVKRISGRIIPAMITTTALITGLVCMEVLKAHYSPPVPLDQYRNAWVNLAVPMMMYSSVEPPVSQPYLSLEQTTEAVVAPVPESWAQHPLREKTWTAWDRMELAFKGDAPLSQLFRTFEEKYSIEISQLVCYFLCRLRRDTEGHPHTTGHIGRLCGVQRVQPTAHQRHIPGDGVCQAGHGACSEAQRHATGQCSGLCCEGQGPRNVPWSVATAAV